MTELDMKWIVPFERYYSEEFLKHEYVLKTKEITAYQRSLGIPPLGNKLEEIERLFGLRILIPPPPDATEFYFGMDTYEGGRDHNAGIIIGEDMRVYAYFKTQRNDIFDLVKWLCDFYSTKLCLERNRGF